MRYIGSIFGVFILLMLLPLLQEGENFECDTVYVPVTQRDGFNFCEADSTVKWNNEWKPATMIEVRRFQTLDKYHHRENK